MYLCIYYTNVYREIVTVVIGSNPREKSLLLQAETPEFLRYPTMLIESARDLQAMQKVAPWPTFRFVFGLGCFPSG